MFIFVNDSQSSNVLRPIRVTEFVIVTLFSFLALQNKFIVSSFTPSLITTLSISLPSNGDSAYLDVAPLPDSSFDIVTVFVSLSYLYTTPPPK